MRAPQSTDCGAPCLIVRDEIILSFFADFCNTFAIYSLFFFLITLFTFTALPPESAIILTAERLKSLA